MLLKSRYPAIVRRRIYDTYNHNNMSETLYCIFDVIYCKTLHLLTPISHIYTHSYQPTSIYRTLRAALLQNLQNK